MYVCVCECHTHTHIKQTKYVNDDDDGYLSLTRSSNRLCMAEMRGYTHNHHHFSSMTILSFTFALCVCVCAPVHCGWHTNSKTNISYEIHIQCVANNKSDFSLVPWLFSRFVSLRADIFFSNKPFTLFEVRARLCGCDSVWEKTEYTGIIYAYVCIQIHMCNTYSICLYGRSAIVDRNYFYN